MSIAKECCASFCAVLAESAPFVVLGFVIAGLLHEFVPASLLRRGVGGRRLAPVLRAVGAGALLPICSCSTIPLGVGLTRSGASIGTALAFMTSLPAISPVTLILGWAILGPMLLGWYSLVAIGAAVLIGVIGNGWLGEAPVPAESPTACGCGCGAKPSAGARLAKAMRWSFGELGVDISASLVLGLVAASLILVSLPAGVVADWLSDPTWIALLAAVAVSLPAYTCSAPSIVIAGSLLARGVDPGVSMAFLIAGPATNLGELSAIRSAMGTRAAVFYACSLITIALMAGAATAWLPSAAVVSSDVHAGHNHAHALDAVVLGSASSASIASTSWWRWPFAVCVLALAARSAFQRVSRGRRWGRRDETPAHNTQPIYEVAAR